MHFLRLQRGESDLPSFLKTLLSSQQPFFSKGWELLSAFLRKHRTSLKDLGFDTNPRLLEALDALQNVSQLECKVLREGVNLQNPTNPTKSEK